jgi:hypothetical protein
LSGCPLGGGPFLILEIVEHEKPSTVAVLASGYYGAQSKLNLIERQFYDVAISFRSLFSI